MVGTRERCDIEICIIELSPSCVTGPCCGLRSARASKPQTIYDFVQCTIYNADQRAKGGPGRSNHRQGRNQHFPQPLPVVVTPDRRKQHCQGHNRLEGWLWQVQNEKWKISIIGRFVRSLDICIVSLIWYKGSKCSGLRGSFEDDIMNSPPWQHFCNTRAFDTR